MAYGALLCGKADLSNLGLLKSKKKITGNHAFFRDNLGSICKKHHTLPCSLQPFGITVAFN